MKRKLFTAVALLSIIIGCKAPQGSQASSSKKGLVLPAFNKEGHRGIRGLMP